MNQFYEAFFLVKDLNIQILSLNFVISAQSFGLPYLSPYLDSLGSNFSHGANFATAGSTIRLQQSVGQFRASPFNLGYQYSQFEHFKPITKFIRDQGIFISYLLVILSFN